MKSILFLLSFSLLGLTPSKEKQQFKLIIFEGSDWCSNCIRLEKNILTDARFTQFLNERNIELVRVDFPQRKKLTTEEKNQNEEIAERYNFSGVFPSIIIPCHKSRNPIVYKNQTVAEFIIEIEAILNQTACKSTGYLID